MDRNGTDIIFGKLDDIKVLNGIWHDEGFPEVEVTEEILLTLL